MSCSVLLWLLPPGTKSLCTVLLKIAGRPAPCNCQHAPVRAVLIRQRLLAFATSRSFTTASNRDIGFGPRCAGSNISAEQNLRKRIRAYDIILRRTSFA